MFDYFEILFFCFLFCNHLKFFFLVKLTIKEVKERKRKFLVDKKRIEKRKEKKKDRNIEKKYLILFF